MNGPILIHDRLDAAAARISWAALADRAPGLSPEDFMPTWDALAESPAAAKQSPADMIRAIRSIQKRKRKRSRP